MLVWHKRFGRACQVYSFSSELIIFAAKGKTNITKSNIIQLEGFMNGAKKYDGTKVHPTQKPTKLISELILDCTKENNVILDCFGGSCTTAVSAIQNKRNFICFELQEKYVEIGNQRIDKAQQAFQAENRNLFEE